MTSAPNNRQPPTSSDGMAGVTIRRSDSHQQRCALALLLTGQAVSQVSAVDPFVSFITDNRFSLEDLWVAVHGETLLASLLIVPGHGRTAMAFVSPSRHRQNDPIAIKLAQTVCRQQDHKRLRLLQVLLDPAQHHECQILQQAGFIKLAELLYMERAVASHAEPLQLSPPITCLHWSESHRHLFADAILTSYQDTLDCPALVGLRKIDDIIASHQASGKFEPDLWFALHSGGEPVAVMLLNLIPRRSAMELVYLGVAPRWRSQGLARKLLTHGLGVASTHGAAAVMLAADRMNKPALRLYRSLRFTSTARRIAMIHVLGK